MLRSTTSIAPFQFLRRLLFSAALILSLMLAPVAPAGAQDPGSQEESQVRSTDVPNPMGTHTWFIILALGGFLAWCISYALELQKDSLSRKKSRQELLEAKERLLDRMAETESQRESGAIGEEKYLKQRKIIRHQLSRALEDLGGVRKQPPER